MFGSICKVDKRIRNWGPAFHGSKVIHVACNSRSLCIFYAVKSFCLLEFEGIWEIINHGLRIIHLALIPGRKRAKPCHLPEYFSF